MKKYLLYEGIISVGFIGGGYCLLQYPIISILLLIAGVLSYGEQMALISNGNFIPFWYKHRKKYRNRVVKK